MTVHTIDDESTALRNDLTEYALNGGRLAVVKAPPGSGKTFTLIEVLANLAGAMRIAVAAQTTARRRWGARRRSTRSRRPARSEVVAKLLECGPARIGRLFNVLVRLGIQVLSAHGAQAGAVGLAQDLLRKGERDRVAHPRRELEPVVDHVVRPQLVATRRIRIVKLAGADGHRHLRMPEAAHARVFLSFYRGPENRQRLERLVEIMTPEYLYG